MSGDSTGSRAGTTFGHYRLERLLGRGGMGEVYLAHDTVKGRDVALKLLHAGAAQDPGFRERFAYEAQTAARLADPHVIPIHDYGEIDGTLYLDMRLVDGSNLADVVAGGPLPAERAVDLIGQVASALDSAHLQGLVHRDVKPANVQLTTSGFAYLLDFGLVVEDNGQRLTSAGLFVGSQAYAAPERFDGGGATAVGDVYSLACMLYELLVGRTPFTARTIADMMRQHMFAPIPRPSQDSSIPVPAGLDAVVARGMAKRPEDRYPTCGSLARAATAALHSDQQSWGATTTVPSGQRPAAPRPPTPPVSIYPQQPPQSHYSLGGPAQQSLPQQYPNPSLHSGFAPAPAPTSRNRALIPVLVLCAVALVVAIVAGVVLLRGGGSSTPATVTTAQSPAPTTAVTSTVTTTTVTPVKAGQPPLTQVCDAGSTALFSSVAADTRNKDSGGHYTSCAFALAIRDAYKSTYRAGESGTVSATSPNAASQGLISMTCAATSNLVTCKGGNDAIVYIY